MALTKTTTEGIANLLVNGLASGHLSIERVNDVMRTFEHLEMEFGMEADEELNPRMEQGHRVILQQRSRLAGNLMDAIHTKLEKATA